MNHQSTAADCCLAYFVVIFPMYCDCNRSAAAWKSPSQGWNTFLAFCAALLAVDIIIVSMKLSPHVWDKLSLPAAVAIINVLIGLLGGLRGSLKDAPIGAVTVPLVHTSCLEMVVTYVKMAHVYEVGKYGWEQQIIFFFFSSLHEISSTYYINSTLLSTFQGGRPGSDGHPLPIANSTGIYHCNPNPKVQLMGW